MNRLLLWLTGFLPCRIISEGDQPYLERYYLMTLFGWRFYIHRFVASDPDRGLHDHPWPKAYSIILSGWYWEELRSGRRKVRWFNSLTGDTFHRVVLPEIVSETNEGMYFHPRFCWTLFFHTVGDTKAWGFWHDKENGDATFTKFHYPGGVKNTDWHHSALPGRFITRFPAGTGWRKKTLPHL